MCLFWKVWRHIFPLCWPHPSRCSQHLWTYKNDVWQVNTYKSTQSQKKNLKLEHKFSIKMFRAEYSGRPGNFSGTFFQKGKTGGWWWLYGTIEIVFIVRNGAVKMLLGRITHEQILQSNTIPSQSRSSSEKSAWFSRNNNNGGKTLERSKRFPVKSPDSPHRFWSLSSKEEESRWRRQSGHVDYTWLWFLCRGWMSWVWGRHHGWGEDHHHCHKTRYRHLHCE